MYSAMEKVGIKIRMFGKNHRINGKSGYLHAKAIVINKQRAWMGSVNGSSTSLNQNREFGIFFNHPARVKAFSEYLSRDFSDSTSQPWRDSLLCHHVGYQSTEVVEDKTPQYKTFIEGIRASNGNGSGLTDDSEEE
jgi:phosphatidylserine/phosphatidylglycerophosphate/cardiolipin synthase-like enzyme